MLSYSLCKKCDSKTGRESRRSREGNVFEIRRTRSRETGDKGICETTRETDNKWLHKKAREAQFTEVVEPTRFTK